MEAMKSFNFNDYVDSGAFHKAVCAATREAAAEARAKGLPVAGPAKVPPFIAAALARPPVKPVPELTR